MQEKFVYWGISKQCTSRGILKERKSLAQLDEMFVVALGCSKVIFERVPS